MDRVAACPTCLTPIKIYWSNHHSRKLKCGHCERDLSRLLDREKGSANSKKINGELFIHIFDSTPLASLSASNRPTLTMASAAPVRPVSARKKVNGYAGFAVVSGIHCTE